MSDPLELRPSGSFGPPGSVVTVSPFSSSSGTNPARHNLPNDGATFGPDTPGTNTGGVVEAEETLRATGGVIHLLPGGPIACRTQVTFYNGVHVVGHGAVLLNQGKLAVPFRTDPNTVFYRTRIEGTLTFDNAFSPKSTVFTVTSAQRSTFDLMVINFNRSVGLSMNVNAQATKGPDSNWGGQNRNNRIWLEGQKGSTLLRIDGADGCEVTENEFYVVTANQMGMDGSLVRLVDFVEHCDNNLVYSANLSIHQNASPGSCEFFFGSAGGFSKVRRNRIYKSTLDNNAPSDAANLAIFGGNTTANEMLGMQYGTNPPQRLIASTPSDTFNAHDLMTNARWVDGRRIDK